MSTSVVAGGGVAAIEAPADGVATVSPRRSWVAWLEPSPPLRWLDVFTAETGSFTARVLQRRYA